MSSDSYAESLSGVLKSARNAPLPAKEEPDARDEILRAAALVAVLSMIETAEGHSRIARDLGSAWTRDHRRIRMGYSNLMRARNRRATWR